MSAAASAYATRTKRPNRTAAERRAQQARADARFAQKLLRLVAQTHRGFQPGRRLVQAAEEPWVRAAAAHDPAPWSAAGRHDRHRERDDDEEMLLDQGDEGYDEEMEHAAMEDEVALQGAPPTAAPRTAPRTLSRSG